MPAMTPERFDQIRSQCECGETPHTHVVEECLEEISRLAGAVYVPGYWRCPKCEFRLTTSIFYAKTGNIGVDRKTPDPCPNDGTVMEPITWEFEAGELSKRISDAVAMGMIHDLRKGQGASVTIVCDNEEGTGADNNAVDVCGEWTDWKDKRFIGKDVRDALWKARSAMYEATEGRA
jgi:hypothetical protein